MLFLKWEYRLWSKITGDFLSSYHSAPFRNWQELDGVAVISRLVSPPFPPGVQVLHTEVAPCGAHTAPHLIPALALISPSSCTASRVATYLQTRKQTNTRNCTPTHSGRKPTMYRLNFISPCVCTKSVNYFIDWSVITRCHTITTSLWINREILRINWLLERWKMYQPALFILVGSQFHSEPHHWVMQDGGRERRHSNQRCNDRNENKWSDATTRVKRWPPVKHHITWIYLCWLKLPT